MITYPKTQVKNFQHESCMAGREFSVFEKRPLCKRGILFYTFLIEVSTIDIIDNYGWKISHFQYPDCLGAKVFKGNDLSFFYLFRKECRYTANGCEVNAPMFSHHIYDLFCPCPLSYHTFKPKFYKTGGIEIHSSTCRWTCGAYRHSRFGRRWPYKIYNLTSEIEWQIFPFLDHLDEPFMGSITCSIEGTCYFHLISSL